MFERQVGIRAATIARFQAHIIRDASFAMTDPVVENLIVDLLEWLAARDRSYEEVMDAWRTSCPQLPVWEDANDRGLLMSVDVGGSAVIRPTAMGLVFLGKHRPAPK